ncbi:S-layer homology domain-containing protein [Paenibacillus sp. MBLB4367]|uniref:S-layer homology domain-containing protein n=1 Tax=Paenibacillus sp. MBLB4367 TaxID=3384767 RepID=UPI00390835B3
MKLTKKVLATTLTAGLVVSSISALPLSSKGIFDKLGLQTASAATLPAGATQLAARAAKIHDNMTPAEKEAVRAARDQIQAAISGTIAQADLDLIDPVWNQIKAKIGNSADFPNLKQDAVLKALLQQASFYNGDFTSQLAFWEGLKNNTILKPAINDLLRLGGITNGLDGVSFNDVYALVDEIEQSGKAALNGDYSLSNFLVKEGAIKAAIKAKLESLKGTNPLVKALYASGVTATALEQVTTNFNNRFNKLKPAALAFASAYSKVLIAEKPVDPGTGGPGGGTPSTGGGTTTTPSSNATLDEAIKALDAIKDQLKNATGDKREELLQQALEKAQAAIDKIAVLDLSSSVKITGDKAKPEIDFAAVSKKIAEIVAQVKKINDQLKALDPNAPVAVFELKLDFGTVAAKTIEIPLLKDLLVAAKTNGIDSIAVKVNGVEVAIASDLFSADTTLTIGKVDKSTVGVATYGSFASDVFSFEFTSGGQAVSNFSTPVELRIPVTATNVDSELLTIAKIVDGKLQYFGGMFNKADGTINGLRGSFSTYTVVENKVSFNDTASVKDWAGRQIDVVAAKGIVEGRAEKQFVPNEKVTRAEFTKMIIKALGLEDASATESFADVQSQDWYKVAVATAVKYGIVNGRTDDKFEPNATITRAEMATIAARALTIAKAYREVADVDAALKSFADASAINASLKSGVALAAKQGIVVGEEGSKFNPNNDSTRAQAAVVIYRLLNK